MKHYTYKALISCEIQITFQEEEVEQESEGREGDMTPTDFALEKIEGEFTECLGQNFAGVENVRVLTDSDHLLGIHEDDRP